MLSFTVVVNFLMGCNLVINVYKICDIINLYKVLEIYLDFVIKI